MPLVRQKHYPKNFSPAETQGEGSGQWLQGHSPRLSMPHWLRTLRINTRFTTKSNVMMDNSAQLKHTRRVPCNPGDLMEERGKIFSRDGPGYNHQLPRSSVPPTVSLHTCHHEMDNKGRHENPLIMEGNAQNIIGKPWKVHPSPAISYQAHCGGQGKEIAHVQSVQHA